MGQWVHPFERANLGHAPFRFVGHTTAKYQACPGAPVQPGAACDYCGTGIMDVYLVESADGRRFRVGSDCVRRTWEEFDATIPADFRKVLAEAERVKREAKRQARHAALQARIAAAQQLLAASPALFIRDAHPYPYYAAQGKTARDYFEWMLKHGGDAGRTAACRAIENAG